MKKQQVAAQLYTVRNFLKTPADIASSLKKVKKIGFSAVQLSGLGPIDTNALRTMLDSEGLVCCATHESSDGLLAEPAAIVDRLKTLDCVYTAYPYPSGVDFADPTSVDTLIKKLDNAGKILAQAGIVLTYHNHNIEFRHISGETILDMIYRKTNPAYVQGEIDTYWVQAGGGDPAAWCRKLSGRLPLLHMKDFGVNEQNQPVFREIGYGNLDWKSIISASEKSGCKWFIIEQDAAWKNDDPFESLKLSFEYTSSKLCE